MRDIVFRGKDTKGWAYGFYREIRKRDGDKLSIIKPPDTDDDEAYYSVVYPETVGQYTGLIDRNGRKIFEGDILEYSDRSIMAVFILKVVYEDASFIVCGDERIPHFRTVLSTVIAKKTRIVGNIYDNPELLKERSD